jgi:hypothetical protein
MGSRTWVGIAAVVSYAAGVITPLRGEWPFLLFFFLLLSGCLSLVAARQHKAWLLLTTLTIVTTGFVFHALSV